MPVFDEETFGPVAAVVRARDEADAVRLANDSAFGLGASLWTRDLSRAEGLAAEIEAIGVRQRSGEIRPAPALRGNQTLGLWPRAVGVRHQGIRQRQVGLDRLIVGPTVKQSPAAYV
jgi:hypothetical protein